MNTTAQKEQVKSSTSHSGSSSEIASTALWKAELELTLALVREQTRLIACRHEGPLRVQKPFVQDDGSCHIYLLHPPGGLVGGDQLSINAHAEAETHTVFTSPSAGKFYRSNDREQRMSVTLNVGANAHLEWLPMETIVFDDAQALIDTRVVLAEDASFLGWEVLCLGRRASGEKFDRGRVRQQTRIDRAGRLLHRECLETSQEWRLGAWGMNSASVVGTLIAVLIPTGKIKDEAQTKLLVDVLRAAVDDPKLAVTHKACTILVRYLGDSAERCRELFETVRDLLHESHCFAHQGSERPRIWKT
ncbi:MAG: urease accessory protein [Candidatus Azotimanducaceae bacterium]|jgi:urease accessory protein